MDINRPTITVELSIIDVNTYTNDLRLTSNDLGIELS
jgi:hypothetical protein